MTNLTNIIKKEKLGFFVNKVMDAFNVVPPGLFTASLKADISFTMNESIADYHGLIIESDDAGLLINNILCVDSEYVEKLFAHISAMTYTNIERSFNKAVKDGDSYFVDLLMNILVPVSFDTEEEKFVVGGSIFNSSEEFFKSVSSNPLSVYSNVITNKIVGLVEHFACRYEEVHNELVGEIGLFIVSGNHDDIHEWVKLNLDHAVNLLNYLSLIIERGNIAQRTNNKLIEYVDILDEIDTLVFMCDSISESLGLSLPEELRVTKKTELVETTDVVEE